MVGLYWRWWMWSSLAALISRLIEEIRVLDVVMCFHWWYLDPVIHQDAPVFCLSATVDVTLGCYCNCVLLCITLCVCVCVCVCPVALLWTHTLLSRRTLHGPHGSLHVSVYSPRSQHMTHTSVPRVCWCVYMCVSVCVCSFGYHGSFMGGLSVWDDVIRIREGEIK